jgi:hypothetical protein
MAAGDPQRIWFEEMIDALRSKWHRDMPFEDMIRLRDDLDRMLQQIRSARQIRSPLFRCPICGHVGEGRPPQVSVRAMILSVIRFDIDDPEPTRAVEKAWKAYQRANHLDVYGKHAAPRAAAVELAHIHSQ